MASDNQHINLVKSSPLTTPQPISQTTSLRGEEPLLRLVNVRVTHTYVVTHELFVAGLAPDVGARVLALRRNKFSHLDLQSRTIAHKRNLLRHR